MALGYRTNIIISSGSTGGDWGRIKRIVNAHKASDFYSNGDTITFTLTDNTSITVELCINAYGRDEIAFIPTAIVASGAYRSSGQGWNGSTCQSWMNGTFYNKLPQDLRDVISPKTLKRLTSLGDSAGYLVSSTDNIWALTVKEVFNGSAGYGGDSESAVQSYYPIFNTTASKSSRGVSWLSGLRQKNNTTANNECVIWSDGSCSSNSGSVSYGYLPCWEIAPDA